MVVLDVRRGWLLGLIGKAGGMCPAAGCVEDGFGADGVYGVPLRVLKGDGDCGRPGPGSYCARRALTLYYYLLVNIYLVINKNKYCVKLLVGSSPYGLLFMYVRIYNIYVVII